MPDPASPEASTTTLVLTEPAPQDTAPDAGRSRPDDPARGWVRRLSLDCWRHRGLTVASIGASTLGVGLDRKSVV